MHEHRPIAACVQRDMRRRLARNVEEMRARLDLTQAELAGLAALHCRHVQKIAAGEGNVTLGTVAKLAAALRVDPTALLAAGPP